MMHWPGDASAAVSLSFDDARLSQADLGIDALNSSGIRGTFYVAVGPMKQRLDAWKRAAGIGHEIGNHTLTHPCSANYEFARKNALEDYTLERIASDIEAADDEIHKLTGIRTTTFAYPCGQSFVGRGKNLRSYIPLVAGRFKIGRGFNDTIPNAPMFFDLAQTLGVDMDMQTFAHLRPLLDLAIAQRSWLVLVGHEVGETAIWQTTLLETIRDIADFAKTSNVWIDTVDTVASHILRLRQPDPRVYS